MTILWMLFIAATAAVGVYLVVKAMESEKLRSKQTGGERIDLRSDGTVVSSDPWTPTPGDIGYAAPPARHYTPHAPAAAAIPSGGEGHSHAGHDAGSYSTAGDGGHAAADAGGGLYGSGDAGGENGGEGGGD